MKFRVMLDKDIKMPTKAHRTDAGFDIYAPEAFAIRARGNHTVDTGVHIEIPEGYVGFLKSKSGLNVKNGIRGEGVIDSGYTGMKGEDMKDLITEMQDIMCRSCTDCEVNWCDGEDKQECCWMGKIAEVGQTIEKEIRNKAIDELVERLKNKLVLRYGNATPTEQYVAMQVTDWCNEISEEMRGAE